MPLIHTTYKPPILFRNNHLNTFWSNRMRGIALDYKRTRYTTADDDFIDVDSLSNHYDRVAFLFHGLEGSSDSTYIKHMASCLHQEKWDIIVMNYRSCSGEINKQRKMYHSGMTDDVAFIVNKLAVNYSRAIVIGFSLGGNLILKYLGEQAKIKPPQLEMGFAISVPTLLSFGAHFIDQTFYKHLFIKSLKAKALLKIKQFPGLFDESRIKEIKGIVEFDDIVTGPLHGFTGAADYYSKNAAQQYIPTIEIPTHIINSLDDPFLPYNEHPIEVCKASEIVTLHLLKYGGHVGFWKHRNLNFIEQFVVSTLESTSNSTKI